MTPLRGEAALLGIDVGTAGCKAAAYRGDGAPVRRAQRAYGHKADGCRAEIDAEEVWQAVCACVREALGGRGGEVKAAAVSAMSDSLVAIDARGRVRGPGILSFDARAAEEYADIAARFGDREVFDATGIPPHPMHPFCRILWLRRRAGEAGAAKYLSFEDFVLLRLGAGPVTSVTTAARTMLFNDRELRWHRPFLDWMGMDESCLPAVAPGGTPVGRVSPEAAMLTGLPARAILVAGGFDQACCALSCGGLTGPRLTDTTGTNGILFFTATEGMREALYRNRLPYNRHADTFSHASFTQIINAGGAFEWVRGLLGGPGYDGLERRMQRRPTGLFFVPFLSGSGTPEMDPGQRAALFGLSLDTDAGRLAQAVLEGVTFEMRHHLTILEEELGLRPEKITALGGASRSPFWMQLKADVTGLPVEAPRGYDPGAAGAAMLAGVGAGVFTDLAQAAAAIWDPVQKDRYEPGPEAGEYRDACLEYLRCRARCARQRPPREA